MNPHEVDFHLPVLGPGEEPWPGYPNPRNVPPGLPPGRYEVDTKGDIVIPKAPFRYPGTTPTQLRKGALMLLSGMGEDMDRQGLAETPDRVAKAWQHWTSGYAADIPSLFKVFEDGAEGYDEMIGVCKIPFYSHCEHHLAPFFGTAFVSYIPEGRVVGLSKLSRVVDAFARRLQVQERLTVQIADAVQEHLNPKGVGVVLRARHLCMESRGICQQGHHTVTSALRGVMKTQPETRTEFLRLCLPE